MPRLPRDGGNATAVFLVAIVACVALYRYGFLAWLGSLWRTR